MWYLSKYHNDGLRVLGVATAFEDFDKNTLENLKLLLTTGEVIEATTHQWYHPSWVLEVFSFQGGQQ